MAINNVLDVIKELCDNSMRQQKSATNTHDRLTIAVMTITEIKTACVAAEAAMIPEEKK